MDDSLQDLIYTSPIYNIGRYPIGYAGVGGAPKIGRPSAWAPFGRRYSFRVHPDPTRLISSTESPPFEGGESPLNLPTLSTLSRHRPPGGESYGLGSHLAA